MKILYPKLVCFGYHFLENLPFTHSWTHSWTRMSGDERCHYHLSNGEAQGSPALVCIAPISLLRTVYLSNLSGMYESLFNRDNKSRGEEK